MNKKNILLTINQLHSGGAEKVVSNLSRELSSSYNVILAIFTDLDKIDYTYGGELIRISLPFATRTEENNILKRAVRFIILVRKLRELKRQRNINVSISFMEVSNIANILSSRREKLVLSVRSYISNEFKDNRRLRIFRGLIKRTYNRSACIVVPTNRIKADLIENFDVRGEKIKVIYNYTDADATEKLSQQPVRKAIDDLLKSHIFIINVGRLTNAKAQWLLPRVLVKIKASLPATKLMILGEGPLRAKLVNETEALGLRIYQEGVDETDSAEKLATYDVFLMGFCKNPFPYLAGSRLFILSSKYEGFPNVIVEAMQCELPVISADCASGPREILHPHTAARISTAAPEYAQYGVLIGPCTDNKELEDQFVAAASESAISIFSNPEKEHFYRQQSKKRAADFNKNKIIQEWIQLIEN